MTRTEIHFEELKDTSLPLPIWYQDRFNKQWKSGKLIFQGKGYACISPDVSNKLFPWKIRPKGAPNIQNGDETTRTPGGRNSNAGHHGSKDLQKALPSAASTYDLPSWRQIKILTNKVKNLTSQQEMPQSPENLPITMLTCSTPS